MRTIFAWVFSLLALVLLVATLLSLIHSNLWWIQALNFPRLLILVVIGVIAIGVAATVPVRWGIGVIAMLALAAGLQAWRMYPYFWFAPVEMEDAEEVDRGLGASCFSVLGLNVYQHNRDYVPTRRMIERMRPDILLLMETDRRWVDALAPSLARYRSRVMRPLDNTYGMVFATNLPVRAAETRDITDQDTPTLYARLATRDGKPFDYVGLHPRPPVPGQDTDRRDRKIERAALALADHDVPRMAMGDFNDVAWSRTTQLFKQVGGFLDPRIGRGSYPTFPADHASLGWPLDQLFLSPAFTFRGLHVLGSVGSDHRPLAATICLSGAPARARNGAPEAVDPQARATARAMTE
ncbi:endonuclease/exonuclease/phosphatase family protein [Sphingomonas sp.]|uniref:endonuclease/exonuclease/phosphatase family protein n=1 Tax=Sphingomonas sp. TaxID=28214 RepID=UPI0035C81CBD